MFIDTPKVAATVRQPNDSLADEAVLKLPEDELKEGGCRFQSEVFKNGAEWNPRVQPFGIMNCVKCHCKVSIVYSPSCLIISLVMCKCLSVFQDGKPTCKRQKCPKLSCSFVRKEPSECCPVCAGKQNILHNITCGYTAKLKVPF